MSHAAFVPICTHLERAEGSGVLVEPEADVNRIAIALFADLVFAHSVLKWLHHLVRQKNVMLLHFASSSHDFLHASMSATLSDD